MELIESVIKRAQANPQRIVLAEGTEERTLKAADQIIAQGIAKITLLGNKQEIEGLAAQFGLKNISKATIIDPANTDRVRNAAIRIAKMVVDLPHGYSGPT